MGVVFSMLWRLDATTACVALFVVALGSLWLYVAFANPSSREYERLEELLSESAVAPSSPAGGGRREGKKGRGKGKTGNESSPRASQSPRKKKQNPETVTPSGSGTESGREEGEGRGGGGERKAPPTQRSKKQVPKTGAATGETVTDKSLAPGDEEGGEFKLVTSKSPRGKKEPAPVVTTSSVETGRDTSAAPVSKKKKKDRSKAAVSKNVSSTAKTTEEERGEIPAVTAITKPEEETPVISKATEIEGDPVASAETTSESDTPKAPAALVCKEDAPGIVKKTRRKGRRKGEPEREGNSERVVSSGSGEEGERGDGEWHTQLSRQQLRALKQKEKKRVLSQQKTTSTSEMTTTTEMVTTTEEKSKEKEGEKGLGLKSLQKTEEGGRVRRERGGGAKRWNLPNTGTATVTEEATPTAVAASSAEDASEGPVAHSNTSDLEKAIREAACTSSSSSEDITSLQTTTTSVATSNNSSLATHTETQSTHTTPTDNVVFPSATVTMDSGPARGPSDEETMGVKGAESPDTDDWVVLEPPT